MLINEKANDIICTNGKIGSVPLTIYLSIQTILFTQILPKSPSELQTVRKCTYPYIRHIGNKHGQKVLEAAVCCFSARSELYNLLSDPDLR
jgi:hypothetical protein